MRKFDKPDIPFKPRNDIEQHICLVISTLCGHEIRNLQTRKEYMESHWNIDDEPIDPEFDFIITSGVKHIDWYCSGHEYGVDVDDSDIIKIEFTAYWRI